MDSRKSGSSSTIEIKGRFVTTSGFQAASLRRGQNAWRLTNLYSVHEGSGQSNVCAHKLRLTLSDIGLERAVQIDKFLVERHILRGEGPPHYKVSGCPKRIPVSSLLMTILSFATQSDSSCAP